MIGVLSTKGREGIITEFFQLFKVQWEFYNSDKQYDIVITDSEIPASGNAKLFILFTSDCTAFDSESGIRAVKTEETRMITVGGFSLPLYCRSASFPGKKGLVLDKETHESIVVYDDSRETVRVGYDLFEEVKYLLTSGQPLQNAETPTLDLHVAILRAIIIASGIPLVEILPVPAGYRFFCCLTHDVDYVGIRRHLFDHSVGGFLLRALPGSLLKFIKGKISLNHLLRNLAAAMSLPLVYIGLAKDFWTQFDWYIKHEGNYPSTFFLSPYKNRAGENLRQKDASRRAMKYCAADIKDTIDKMLRNGKEIGVHGIDAWHSEICGKDELKQIASLTKEQKTGVRMHWLCFKLDSPLLLEKAGYDYDSTCGYNETPGCKAGTFQPFLPPGCSRMLEIPMHIQDCTLFYPSRMGLTQEKGLRICDEFIKKVQSLGGVLTLLWHQRSPGPERNWGEAYRVLLEKMKQENAYITSCNKIVEWYRARRTVSFREVTVKDSEINITIENASGLPSPAMTVSLFHGKKDFSSLSLVSDARSAVPVSSDKITIMYENKEMQAWGQNKI